jgi:hypothetical protein
MLTAKPITHKTDTVELKPRYLICLVVKGARPDEAERQTDAGRNNKQRVGPELAVARGVFPNGVSRQKVSRKSTT